MEALGEKKREVIGHQRPKLILGAERAVRGPLLDALQKRPQRRFTLGRGLLDVEQHRLPGRERELVLDARDSSPRSAPPVALPVDAEEDIALCEVRRVEVARRVRARALLEEDRCQAQRRDRLADRRALEAELAKRRRDEDA